MKSDPILCCLFLGEGEYLKRCQVIKKIKVVSLNLLHPCSDSSDKILQHLRGYRNHTQTRNTLTALPEHAATAVAQLRAGYTPLTAFLDQINAVEDPKCPECNEPETTEHNLLLCRIFTAH